MGYSYSQVIYQYLIHFLKCKGANQLHSPFVFRFYNDVLRKKSPKHQEIEALRATLKRSKNHIEQIDFKTNTTWLTSVGKLATTSPTPAKFSLFLQRLIHFLEGKVILETGTSLGLNTLYLSKARDITKVITIEANPQIAQLAKENFEKLGSGNIKLLEGELRKTLPLALKEQPEVIFLDADHSKSGIEYCLNTILSATYKPLCILIHDIYWSEETKKTWNEVIANTAFPLTIDLFYAGVLFPGVMMEKQHFHLRM